MRTRMLIALVLLQTAIGLYGWLVWPEQYMDLQCRQAISRVIDQLSEDGAPVGWQRPYPVQVRDGFYCYSTPADHTP